MPTKAGTPVRGRGIVIMGIEGGKQVTLDIHRHRVPLARGGGRWWF